MESEIVTKQAEKGRRDIFASIYDWVEAALLSLVVVVLLFTFLFRTVGVVGPSMQNTLWTGDRLLLTYLFYEPERGDIVVIDRYSQEPLIKRVIAVAGDTVEIDPLEQKVYLNGVLLDEPYIDGNTPPKEMFESIYIPDGYIFVMGDNRFDSKDSRDSEIGLVSVSTVVGKAIFRIWPLNQFGIIN